MTNQMAKMSPRGRARIAGAFEAAEGVTSAYGQVVILGRLVVSGSAGCDGGEYSRA